MNKPKNLIVLTILIIALFLISLYGFSTNYFIGDDLPLVLSVLNEINRNYPPINPYFDEGNPDLHNGPYFVLISLLTKNVTSLENIFSMLFFIGIINIALFVFSFYLFVKKLTNKKTALLSTVLIFLITEVPLIRWTGIVSFHSIMYNSYLPQMFSLSFFFLTLWSALLYLENKKLNGLLPFSLFFLIVFLNHLLSGLILVILVSALSIEDYFNYKNRKSLLLIVYVLLSIIISFLWPFFSVIQVLNSINNLYFYLIIAIIAISIFIYILNKFSLFKENPNIGRYQITLPPILALIGLLIVILMIDNTRYYLYGKDVQLWWISFLPLILFTIIPLLNVRTLLNGRGSFALTWILLAIIPYIFGMLGYEIKTYWRFFLFIKFPLVIILSKYLYEIFNKNQEYIKNHLIVLFIIIISTFSLTLTIVDNSDISNHFKDIPYEYDVHKAIENHSNLQILSDPFTSYYITATTKNKVIAVPEDRVSDYDLNIAEKRLYDSYIMLYSEDVNRSLDLFKLYGVDMVILNKHLIFSVNPTMYIHTKSEAFYPLTKYESLGFKIIVNNNNYLVLMKNE